MKFRYLKINGEFTWGFNTLTKEILAILKNGSYDAILDLQNSTKFDAEKNEWVNIEGDL